MLGGQLGEGMTWPAASATARVRTNELVVSAQGEIFNQKDILGPTH